MIKFPPEYAATWFPGYFWNTQENRLYSLKIDGILKPLKMCYPNKFNKLHEPGYRVSVEGQRRFMLLSLLKKYTHLIPNAEIPVKK